MYCGFCGKKIEDNSRFCPYCGKSTDNEESSEKEQKRKKKKKSAPNWFMPLVILELIFIFLISIAVYRIYKDHSLDNELIAYYEPVDEEKIRYEQGEKFVEGHLLLTAKEDAVFEDIETLIQKHNGEIIGYISLTQDYQLQFKNAKDKESLLKLISEIKKDKQVESVILENVFEITHNQVDYGKDPWISTNRPDLKPGWNEIPSGSNWWATAIHMPEIWSMNYDFKTVRVGLIDSYFDTENDDLKDAFAKNGVIGQDQLNITALYKKAKKEEQKGVETKPTSSEIAHGTHCAGLIGARSNEFGICGTSQNAELYGVSLYGNHEQWNFSMMTYKYAIATLISKKVKVISISMGADLLTFAANMEAYGGDGRTTLAIDHVKYLSDTLTIFLKRCLKHYDFLIIKSAGNNSGGQYVETAVDKNHPYGYRNREKQDPDSAVKQMKCDAKYDFFGHISDPDIKNHLIIVGSVDCVIGSRFIPNDEVWLPNKMVYDYELSFFTNIRRPDIYAPGGFFKGYNDPTEIPVLSDVPDDGTDYMSGTSMATPIVAGVSALVWGTNSNMTAVEVRDTLLKSADIQEVSKTVNKQKASPGQDSFKVVNAVKAVNEVTGHDPTTDRLLEETSFFMGITYETTVDKNGQTQQNDVPANITIEDASGDRISDIVIEGNQFMVELSQGTYNITLTAAGYETITDSITAEEGKTLFKAYEMKPEVKDGVSYASVIEMLEKEYGTFGIKIGDKPLVQYANGADYLVEAIGLCYLRLIDFNNDGVQELLAVAKHENDPEYTVMVYTQNKGRAEQLISSEGLTTFHNYYKDSGYSYCRDLVLLTNANQQTFINSGFMTDLYFYDEIYGYEDSEFKLISATLVKSYYLEDNHYPYDAHFTQEYYVFDEPMGMMDDYLEDFGQWRTTKEEYYKALPSWFGQQIIEDRINFKDSIFSSSIAEGDYYDLDPEALKKSVEQVKQEVEK